MAWLHVPPHEWIDTEAKLKKAVNYLLQHSDDGIGYDTETSGTAIEKDIPLMFSMSDGVKRFAFWAEQFLHHPLIKDEILCNPHITKVGTNLKFDCHMTANVGIVLRGPYEDTLVQDFIYDENRNNRHGLKETALDHCNLKMFGSFREVFQPKKKSKGQPAETTGDAIRRMMFDEGPEKKDYAINYSSLDAYASMLVRNELRARLQNIRWKNDLTLWDYYIKVERPFTKILWKMERRGFALCSGHLKTQINPMKKVISAAQHELNELVGHEINPRSTLQLRKLFFEELGRTSIKRTKPGKVTGESNDSTDQEVLNKWASDGCDISRTILKLRSAEKMYSTYVVGLLKQVDRHSLIHTTLTQHVAVTGRLSSVRPNLQNVPARTVKLGDKDNPLLISIRKAFTPKPGYALIVLDYDQLELKIMAHVSQDEKMIQAILDGKDLHCFTVSQMAKYPYEDVVAAKKAKDQHLDLTDEQKVLVEKRQSFKRTVFGVIYGIGRNKLAHQLTEDLDRSVSPKEAQGYIDGYLDTFPKVRKEIEDTKRLCRQQGFVTTISGRYRRLPTIKAGGGTGGFGSATGAIVAEAERQAVNVRIQGTAADIVKDAMIKAEKDAELKRLRAEMLLQVHDELIFQCPDEKENIQGTISRARWIMENTKYKLSVPLTAGGGYGYNWEDAK